VIGTTADTSFVDSPVSTRVIYRIRAVDARGNKSATSGPVTVTPPEPADVFIAAGATWRYLDDGSDQGTAWRDAGFDDSAWPTGAAQLGFGDGDEATVIAEGAPRHITAYFRSAFAIAQASDYTSLMLSVVRDDGVVVYLNGQEILRDNMPLGPVVNGVNTVAVEIHSADIGSADLSFDLSLTLEP
jgi:hypothetical protein